MQNNFCFYVIPIIFSLLFAVDLSGQTWIPPIGICWGGSLCNGLAAFQAATGNGQGCLESNPLFAEVASNNFHLQTTSPAIDAGKLEESIYQIYQTLYGVNIRLDPDKVLRPQGTAWDIGAYEYGANSQSQLLNLTPGWNWVAYLPTTATPIATALASIGGQVLEVKSRAQSATYNGGAWTGTLTQLEPGQGYAIRMSAPGTLIYPEVL